MFNGFIRYVESRLNYLNQLACPGVSAVLGHMTIYLAIVYAEPNGTCSAHFPDVPGCFTAADNLEELPAMCADALDCHLWDQEAPVPRAFAAILAEAREELAEGGFLMAVEWERKPG
jgi:predicted RNase H-like HicB family nuclease